MWNSISKLYNGRRNIVDSTIKSVLAIPPPAPNIPAKTYKQVSEQLIRSDVIDGVTTNTYRSFVEVTHIYNNKGVVTTTHHNNTFTYVV